MLTGPQLGAAIEAARLAKNMSKKALAEQFGVKPPSVQGWINTGRIDKAKLIELISFFSDVVGAEHWGLSEKEAELIAPSSSHQHPGSSAAEKVMEMLQRHGKGLSGEAKAKIAQAVAESLDGDLSTTSNVIHADFSRTTLVKGNTISIAQYDVRAAMGGGQVPAEYREFVRNLVVDKVQLDDLGLKYSDATNLKIITGWGQSMLGTIDDKSLIIVDVGITDFVEEGVYVFTWLQHLFVKRVQIHDAEHYLLVSDNKSFEPQKARMEDVHFQAKVLGAWNFRKL
ncbi:MULTISPECIES: S24 family peptidase [Pseudomonas aeruginosa group]|uniref:Transcriptional regulator, Cro/CI family n=1 Tax=Pseudomonas paraeruginosa (strain DSM 24068 / PA7) TaxID=381754 RepID=A6V3X6_PSEP7|nr:S24 family peptidase [Pseudomonas aeruginosa]ABR85070.1 transcriptional regulator, Cro/CI family [Pseudomonas aeruginosa PA7]MCW8362088.1 XRE family transcriptional regulator [Pseudomonas aeruginosa]MCW8368486.1 XRE family transcriptional regulator [Pseudomonas aeruginosa]MCW8415545.1 XRE family transcriptional regulator [Pseudomonas aeruginosa]